MVMGWTNQILGPHTAATFSGAHVRPTPTSRLQCKLTLRLVQSVQRFDVAPHLSDLGSHTVPGAQPHILEQGAPS